MNKDTNKKPAVHRTRQLNQRVSPAVIIAVSVAAVVLIGILITVFVIFGNKKKAESDSGDTPQTVTEQTEALTAPSELSSEAVTESDTAPSSASESQSSAPAATQAEDPYRLEAAKLTGQMTLDQQLDQMFITTPEALLNETRISADLAEEPLPYVSKVGDKTKETYRQHPVGGFLLTSASTENRTPPNAQQLAGFCTDLQALDPSIPLLLCANEDYLQELDLNQLPGSVPVPESSVTDGSYAVTDEALKAGGLNVVFSDCSSQEGQPSAQIDPSVKIIDTDGHIDALNASGGFLAKYDSIQNMESYDSTAATNMAYRKEPNNRALVVFADGFYSVSQDPQELRNIGNKIRQTISKDGQPPVIVSDISHADADDTESTQTAEDGSGSAQTAEDSAGSTQTAEDGTASAPAADTALSPAVSSILAGADMLLCTDGYAAARRSMLDALSSGVLKESDIAACAERILAMKLRYFGAAPAQDTAVGSVTVQPDGPQVLPGTTSPTGQTNAAISQTNSSAE